MIVYGYLTNPEMKKLWNLQNYAIISVLFSLLLFSCRYKSDVTFNKQFPTLCSEQFLLLEIDRESILCFYSQPNYNHHKDSITLPSFCLEAEKITSPIAIDRLRGVIMWNIMEQKNDMVKLCTKDSLINGRWLKITSNSIIGNAEQVLQGNSIPKPVFAYVQMDENARKINPKHINCAKVLAVQGDWLGVHFNHLPCAEILPEVNLDINGYVRWRKESALLIDLL